MIYNVKKQGCKGCSCKYLHPLKSPCFNCKKESNYTKPRKKTKNKKTKETNKMNNLKNIKCPKCGRKLKFLGVEGLANFDCVNNCKQRFGFKDLINEYFKRIPLDSSTLIGILNILIKNNEKYILSE